MELSSPFEEKPLKNNIIDTSPLNTATYSLSSISEDADIRNIFSVNIRSSDKFKNEGAISEKRTISEISDDIFLVKPECNVPKSGTHKSYKQKLTDHLKKIKEKASTPSREVYSKTRGKIPVEKIRRESENVNAEVEVMRSRLNLKNTTVLEEKEGFFNFSSEKQEKVRLLINFVYSR